MSTHEEIPRGSLWGIVQTQNQRKVIAVGVAAFVCVTMLAILLALRTELSIRDAQLRELAGKAPARTLAKDAILLPVNLSLKVQDGKTILRVTLPSEVAHRDVLTRARNLYGNVEIDDRLEVKTNVALTPWFDSVIKWFPPAISGLKSGEITVSGLEVLLFGEVSSGEERDNAGRLVEQLAGNEAKIHNGLRINVGQQVK